MVWWPRVLGLRVEGWVWQVSSGRTWARTFLLWGAEARGCVAHRVSFLAQTLTGMILPWESLGSAPDAPLVLICSLQVLPELPTTLPTTKGWYWRQSWSGSCLHCWWQLRRQRQEQERKAADSISKWAPLLLPQQPSASRNTTKIKWNPLVSPAWCDVRATQDRPSWRIQTTGSQGHIFDPFSQWRCPGES